MKIVIVGCAILVAAMPAGAETLVVPAIMQSNVTATASSTMQNTGGQSAPNTAVNDVPATMPPAIKLLAPDRPLLPREKEAATRAARWQQKPTGAHLDATGVLRFPFGGSEPTVVCQPLHICDISLQPGESILGTPALSDPAWRIMPGYSRDGRKTVAHIMVKPSDNGLDGNLVVGTDRRTYSIRLVSSDHTYMPKTGFLYDDEEPAAVAWGGPTGEASITASVARNVCAGTAIVPPSAYSITGPNKPWSPMRDAQGHPQVFTVGTPVGQKTCIQFSADIGSHALPTLFNDVKSGGWFSDDTTELVSARFQDHFYIVDEPLDHFVLTSGVGSVKEVNEIKRIAP